MKILQFSPEVLTTFYTNVSDLCFSPGTTAITKIMFYSLFEYCVMLFIFLIYLGQKYLSKWSRKSLKKFRARLVQLFLLVVLFSYQKMVIGAFTLVQCVDIENSTVLYVQGNIKCFTWWQTATEVYIFLNVIPLLFVLSHAPFLVEDKKMSVRMFILSCLLPVPGMVIYYLQRFLKMKQVRKKQVRTLVPNLESEISSLSENTVISEQDQAQ